MPTHARLPGAGYRQREEAFFHKISNFICCYIEVSYIPEPENGHHRTCQMPLLSKRNQKRKEVKVSSEPVKIAWLVVSCDKKRGKKTLS